MAQPIETLTLVQEAAVRAGIGAAPFPVAENARTKIIHDDCSGTIEAVAHAGTRLNRPGPGAMKVANLRTNSIARYENGRLVLAGMDSGENASIIAYGTNNSSDVYVGGITAAAGLAIQVRAKIGVAGSNLYSTFQVGFGASENGAGYTRGAINVGVSAASAAAAAAQEPYLMVYTSRMNASSGAAEIPENLADTGGYPAFPYACREGDEIALRVRYKTLSHQVYEMQGGQTAQFGCEVGSDNWYEIGNTYGAISGTVYPFVAWGSVGIHEVYDVQILSSVAASYGHHSFQESRRKLGLHVPCINTDPVTGLVVFAWNDGYSHYGATSLTQINASVRLADGSWSARETILADPGSSTGQQVLHLSQVKGALWLVYYRTGVGGGNDDGGTMYHRTVTVNATTGAITLGAEVSFGLDGTKRQSFSEIVETDTGRLVMPGQFSPATNVLPTCIYSDDDGATWTEVLVCVAAPADALATYLAEGTIAKEAGGDLAMYLRTQNTAFYSRSTDDGETWSTPVARTEFPMPGTAGCRLTAKNLADGGALLVGNDHQTQRRNFSLWKVDENGAVVWKKNLGDLTDRGISTAATDYTLIQYPVIEFSGPDMILAWSNQQGVNTDYALSMSLRAWTMKNPLLETIPATPKKLPAFRPSNAFYQPYATAPVPDLAKGKVFYMTLTASTATYGVPLNPLPFDELTLVMIQGGSGSYTAAFNAIFDFGGIAIGTVPWGPWKTAVGATNVLRAIYNGHTNKWVVTSFT